MSLDDLLARIDAIGEPSPKPTIYPELAEKIIDAELRGDVAEHSALLQQYELLCTDGLKAES